MKQGDAIEAALRREGVMKQHFPYVSRGVSGEYVIPEGRLQEFILKCLEVVDKEDHLEHLRYYREQGVRPSDVED